MRENFMEDAAILEDCNYSFKSVNIYSGEPVNSWILGKFVKKLQSEYEKSGIKTTISHNLNNNADFNQYIIYLHCDKDLATDKDILMITHLGNYEKFELVKELIPKVRLGICMSKDQMQKLINLGIDKNKLCYINPAHDEVIPVRKYVIALASRVYSDGRKNEEYFCKLADVLNPQYFKFKIMGANWGKQIEYMRLKGFEIEYYSDFDYEIYTQKFFADVDYYLYMGWDEGQMGFVDAQSAGVKTIVTAQGYHLDSNNSITHPFMTYEELEKIFLDLQSEKLNIVNQVRDWTWSNYALKHLQIFEYLHSGRIIQNDFKDGLNSLLENINSNVQIQENAKEEYINYLKKPAKHNNEVRYDYELEKIPQKFFYIQKVKTGEYKRKILYILGIKITTAKEYYDNRNKQQL